MTSVATSATVVSLVAEVRVLMVGSRQITLSVFRQLDVVPFDRCEAMGRVNDSRADFDAQWLVGRDRETGVLVRSQLGEIPTWSDDRKARLETLERKEGQYGFSDFDRAQLLALRERARLNEPENLRRYGLAKRTRDSLPLIVLAGLK